MVGYDSIIPPGRVGKVTQEIDIHKARPGAIRKSVTVESNAGNSPRKRLSLKARILAPVDVNPARIDLASATDGKSLHVDLVTDREDLTVSRVVFQQKKEQGRQTGWQKTLALPISFSFEPSTRPEADGLYSHTLRLHRTGDKGQSLPGEFVITTSHPRSREVHVDGTIAQ